MASKLISLGTDVATLVLFHPDDLQHRHRDPIAWYAYDFAYRKESAAGNLVAFVTGSDGGYDVRLTTGDLTEAEANAALAPWAFPYVVRHRRVLLDNTDALPGEERQTDPDMLAEQWFELENGSYRVSVYPIQKKEPEPHAGPHAADPTETLPDYVVTFAKSVSLDDITVAANLPDLRPFGDWRPSAAPSMAVRSAFDWPQAAAEGGAFPVIEVGPNASLLPGQSDSVAVSDQLFAGLRLEESGWDVKRVIALPMSRPGSLGVLSEIRGWSTGRDGRRIDLRPLLLVRVERLQGEGPNMTGLASVVPKPDLAAADAPLPGLREKIAANLKADPHAESRLGSLSFELERLSTLSSAEAVTGFALARLDLTFERRLSGYARSAADRIALLEAYLDRGDWPAAEECDGAPGKERRSLAQRLRSLFGG